MKVGLAAAAAFAAVLLGGCISVSETVLADESLSVEVIDSGWYIFGCIPVLSGNPDGIWPHWFTDDLDPRTTMKVLDRIVDRGNTVIIIEHNLDVVKMADWIIDMGPEGGRNGGEIVAVGTPEQLVAQGKGYTAQYLKQWLDAESALAQK